MSAHISIEQESIPLMQCLQKLILAEGRRMWGVMRSEGSLMFDYALSCLNTLKIIDLRLGIPNLP
jgi:hypothetical protein